MFIYMIDDMTRGVGDYLCTLSISLAVAVIVFWIICWIDERKNWRKK